MIRRFRFNMHIAIIEIACPRSTYKFFAPGSTDKNVMRAFFSLGKDCYNADKLFTANPLFIINSLVRATLWRINRESFALR